MLGCFQIVNAPEAVYQGESLFVISRYNLKKILALFFGVDVQQLGNLPENKYKITVNQRQLKHLIAYS
jgi:hypothetical protein